MLDGFPKSFAPHFHLEKGEIEIYGLLGGFALKVRNGDFVLVQVIPLHRKAVRWDICYKGQMLALSSGISSLSSCICWGSRRSLDFGASLH